MLESIPLFVSLMVSAADDCGIEKDLVFLSNPELDIDPASFAIPQCDESIYNFI